MRPSAPATPPLPACFGQIDVSQPTLEIAVGGQRAAGQKIEEARRRFQAKKPGVAALGYAKTPEPQEKRHLKKKKAEMQRSKLEPEAEEPLILTLVQVTK